MKDCHGTSPRGVSSIVLYMCVALENGGSSLWGARDAAQRLRIKSISLADIWLRRNRKSATSNSTRLLYGLQLLGPRSESRGGGGVSAGISLPSSSQIFPIINNNLCQFFIKNA